MIQETIHNKICDNISAVENWFVSHKQKVDTPFYTSIDIRDSGFKIVSVDANIYPAGFNNICPTDKEMAPEIVKKYITHNYGTNIKNIALLTEEHTKNVYYWENVLWILSMIEQAGYNVRVCLPQEILEPIMVPTLSGEEVKISVFKKQNGELIGDDDFRPEVIISNNDFSNAYEVWSQDLKTPINPPRELGWHQRKKSNHFKHYNKLVTEFANILDIDPWIFTIQTEVYKDFNVNDLDSRQSLSENVEGILGGISTEYQNRNIQEKPTLFIKNNAGTYGLGVARVSTAEEVLQFNSKTRSKLNASKGGREVNEVILQEGVSTNVRVDGVVSEPVVYMLGCELAGGFFRTHAQKSADDSLNAPGAIFKKMCVTDLKIKRDGCPIENVYGWIARISSLAIGYEIRDLNLKIGNPSKKPGCA